MNPAERSVPSEPPIVGLVRAELQAIVHSEIFEHSPQLQRFLRYLVEETLAGRGPRLKEYVIGTEVFGRPSDYDPQLDSLVRVEAHRLRAVLEQYYTADVPVNAVRIEIKKGSYVPVFQDTARSEPQPAMPTTQNRVRLWYLVSPGRYWEILYLAPVTPPEDKTLMTVNEQ
jgi:adenylate cyclase